MNISLSNIFKCLQSASPLLCILHVPYLASIHVNTLVLLCLPETYLRSICSRYTHTGTGANLGKIYFTSPNYPNLIEASDQECYCDIEAFFKNSISLFNMDMYDACKKGAVQIYDGQGNRVAMDCESTTLASVKNKIEIVYNRNCTTSPFWLDFRGKLS